MKPQVRKTLFLLGFLAFLLSSFALNGTAFAESTHVTSPSTVRSYYEFFHNGLQMNRGDYITGPTVQLGGGNYKYHQLILQYDGNLVLYSYAVNSSGYVSSVATWSSRTQGRGYAAEIIHSGDLLVLQQDGTTIAWQSNTFTPDGYGDVQADGNFVMYTFAHYPLWASNTAGK